MKIALVTETYPPEINGVAMTLSRLVDGLLRLGHEMDVVRPRQGRDDSAARGERLAEWLAPGGPLPGYEGLHFGLPSKRGLVRRWRRHRPDVVHVATEGPLGWSAVRAARALGIPVVSSFHTNFHSYGKHYGYGMFIRVALGWLRHVHNLTRRTFVPSRDLLTTLEADGFRNLRILSRGVDTQLFDPARRNQALRTSWGVDDSTPVAIYVGRLAGEKNIPLTIEAFLAMRELVPELRLVLVGDGPERKRLEREHPEFHFAGLRRGEDLAAHYASGDVFLFASVTETFGNVVTEAMASGLAVLAYDYAAPQQYIINGRNGVKVPYDDGRAFLEAARQLARNRSAWPQLRREARETTLTISWDTVIRGYVQELETVLEEAASVGREESVRSRNR